MKNVLLVFVVVLSACDTGPDGPVETIDPFAVIRQAYATRDPQLAASAYLPDAVLTYDFDNERVVYTGAEEIAGSFADFLTQVPLDEPLDINFRVENRLLTGELSNEKGYYRLRGSAGFEMFGRFEVRRDMTARGAGRLRADYSTSASNADFEKLPGPPLFDAGRETLDPHFYGRLSGRYRLQDGCLMVITHSTKRLYARNSCTNRWQGLKRVSGLVWTGGATVSSATPTHTYTFTLDSTSADAPARALAVEHAQQRLLAEREHRYQRESVVFESADGRTLGADLYRPVEANGRATVLVPGAGAQDRNGHASLNAVLADALAGSGQTVLSYDKRGVRHSTGNWRQASFADLAADARAALDYLRGLQDVDDSFVGLAGSGQAGWVIARAIEQGAQASHVYLISAAGAALTLEEQYLYSSEVQMRCAGLAPPDRERVLRQRQAFVDFVSTGDADSAARLDEMTLLAAAEPALEEWLMPDSAAVNLGADDWYTTLETGFDPLPVWRNYPGDLLLLFAEFDDITPSSLAMQRVQPLVKARPQNRRAVLLSGAQHRGLQAASVCDAGMSGSLGFAPALFSLLRSSR